MNMQRLMMSVVCAASMLAAQADNTKQNKRDRDDRSATADQQGDNEQDREITRKIRKALVDDKGLSTYGKNVKIVTRAGKVTLRGPVNSDEEKRRIETLATSAAGAANVMNELEVVVKK